MELLEPGSATVPNHPVGRQAVHMNFGDSEHHSVRVFIFSEV